MQFRVRIYYQSLQTKFTFCIKDLKLQTKMFDLSKQVKVRKPSFELGKKVRPQQSYEQKLKKIQIFNRYRTRSIYRQLKIAIYQKPYQQKKPYNPPAKNSKKIIAQTLQQRVQGLYKVMALNSKYHHREKIRWNRMPLLNYIQYDFNLLVQKMKSKKYLEMYDDLVESDEEKQDIKKQFEKDPQFSITNINNYKKKNNINGRIVIAQGYEDLKQRLVVKHKWTENVDTTSLIYDFKYMSKKSAIDYVNLLDSQIVNHFHQNKSITAKFGLTRNIRNVVILGNDHNSFYPRCYDVNDVKEFEDFYEDFKMTQGKKILRDYIIKGGLVNEKQAEIIKLLIKYLSIQTEQFEKRLNLILNDRAIYIVQNEWKTIRTYFEQNIQSKQSKQVKDQMLFKQALELTQSLKKSDPQFYLNQQNIWIVKPASMSRGRGIKTFNQINQILDYIIGKQISWVVQKYIQRPLIIRKKKFDIRQWVLFTDFKPFRVWIYQQCYVRFCSDFYEPLNLKNRKIHLTNNSVTKGVNTIEDGIQENMMSEQEFCQQLKKIQEKQIFKTLIKPQLCKIAIESLESVKQNIVSRKNTFQLLGYDFMIDENYKAWLIEVNSSPTMEHSTLTTKRIVQKGMSDLADLVQNYMMKGKVYNHQQAKQLYGGWKLLTNAQ